MVQVVIKTEEPKAVTEICGECEVDRVALRSAARRGDGIAQEMIRYASHHCSECSRIFHQ